MATNLDEYDDILEEKYVEVMNYINNFSDCASSSKPEYLPYKNVLLIKNFRNNLLWGDKMRMKKLDKKYDSIKKDITYARSLIYLNQGFY